MPLKRRGRILPPRLPTADPPCLPAPASSPLRCRLLASHRDTSREVCLAAEECLELVAATSEPRRCLAVLIPVAAREEAPVLQASGARTRPSAAPWPQTPGACAGRAATPLTRRAHALPTRAPQASVRLISRIVPRMGAPELQLLLPQLLPPLFDAFKSPSADVRKAVVFALVDMFLVLGDELTPHLSELSTSQLKLVTIYINRSTKARAENPI